MSSNINFGYSYKKAGLVGGLSSYIPSLFVISISLITSILIVFLGSIKNISSTLGIDQLSDQSIGKTLSSGFSAGLDRLQSLPFSDTIVVFTINFLVALVIINVFSYAFNLRKELKEDVNEFQQPNSINKVNFIKKVSLVLLHRLTVSGFGVIWAIALLFFLIPSSLKLSNTFLQDFGNINKIGYLILGFLLIFMGLLITNAYIRFMQRDHFYQPGTS